MPTRAVPKTTKARPGPPRFRAANPEAAFLAKVVGTSLMLVHSRNEVTDVLASHEIASCLVPIHAARAAAESESLELTDSPPHNASDAPRARAPTYDLQSLIEYTPKRGLRMRPLLST